MISGQSHSNNVYRKRQPLGEVSNTYRVKNNGNHQSKHAKQALYFPHPAEISNTYYP